MNHLSDEDIRKIVESDGNTELDAHLAACPECRLAVDRMLQLHTNLASLNVVTEAPLEINAKIMSSIYRLQQKTHRSNTGFLALIFSIFGVLIAGCLGISLYFVFAQLKSNPISSPGYFDVIGTKAEWLVSSVTRITGNVNSQMLMLAILIFVGSIFYISVEQYRSLRNRF